MLRARHPDAQPRRLRRTASALVAFICATAVLSTAAPSAARPAIDCPRFLVLSVRGSGDHGLQHQGMGAPGEAVYKSVQKALGQYVTSDGVGVDYPAAGLQENWREWLNAVGAGAKVPHLGAYHDSVEKGKVALLGQITQTVHDCGDQTAMILTGYSQGAQVTAETLEQMPKTWRKHIAGVILFGDPYFNHSDAFAGMFPRSLVRDGVLGKRKTYPDVLETRVLSFCHDRDPVCQSPLHPFSTTSFAQHTNYQSDKRDTDEAVRWITASGQRGFTDNEPPHGFAATLRGEGAESPTAPACDLFQSTLGCLFIGQPRGTKQCDAGGPAPYVQMPKSKTATVSWLCIDEHFADWLSLRTDRPRWAHGGFECDLLWEGTGVGRSQKLDCHGPRTLGNVLRRHSFVAHAGGKVDID